MWVPYFCAPLLQPDLIIVLFFIRIFRQLCDDGLRVMLQPATATCYVTSGNAGDLGVTHVAASGIESNRF